MTRSLGSPQKTINLGSPNPVVTLISTKLNLKQFYRTFVEPLKRDDKCQSYLFRPLIEICAGWKQETLNQNIIQMTKMNTTPIPLVFSSANEMSVLSNKIESLTKIYQHMNYNQWNRVDAFMLLAMILISIDGTFETLLKGVIFIFGFSDVDSQTRINKDEFSFFLECMFKAVMLFAMPPARIETTV